MHVVFQFQDQDVTAIFRDRHPLSPGDRGHLALDTAHLHLFDADTGAPIEGFDFCAALDGGMTRRFVHRRDGGTDAWTLQAGDMRWNDFEGRAPLRRLPRGASVRWTVDAEGFEPVRGTEAAFAEHPAGFSELRVMLERS